MIVCVGFSFRITELLRRRIQQLNYSLCGFRTFVWQHCSNLYFDKEQRTKGPQATISSRGSLSFVLPKIILTGNVFLEVAINQSFVYLVEDKQVELELTIKPYSSPRREFKLIAYKLWMRSKSHKQHHILGSVWGHDKNG